MSSDETLNASPAAAVTGIDVHSLAFAEALYADFLGAPDSVPAEWRAYFEQLAKSGSDGFVPPDQVFARRSLFHARSGTSVTHLAPATPDDLALQERVDRLVHAYRVRGHIIARVDPLNRPGPETPELTPEFYGLSAADVDRPLASTKVHDGEAVTLRYILQRMRHTYCRSIGAQFMHIDELSVRKWLQRRMEATENRLKLTKEEQLRILRRLTDASIFEEFLAKKYVGAKSFSLEGGETLIPLLDLVIEKGAEDGIEEIVLGMAHRGRLNVLANILGKPPRAIFREFEDADPDLHAGSGDVKYHLGHSSDWKTSTGKTVHLSLCFNPSHLEFINPVALGRTRAKQDRFGDAERRHGMTLLIHGDAAFAGEGIIQETLNLSELAAYEVGGTIHVVINNQIGFTTLPRAGRSSTYATDVAKMLQIPIFHVNGEDPEAVAQVVRLALDFRREYQRDVVIDMYCYRRHGHSEGDEPTFTQPVMYRTIEARDPVRENYLERLLLLGEVTVDEADAIAAERRAFLEQELTLARDREYTPVAESPTGVWAGYLGHRELQIDEIGTRVPTDRLSALLETLVTLPPDFHPHPKIERMLSQRREMAQGKRPLDWSAGEALALASLAAEGCRLRMTGQDTERGTFSQRHAVLHDVTNGHRYPLFEHVDPEQAPVEIANSPLSEAGVLGFEYGYSLDAPETLVLWEAQFGDFVNVAQVIIDQFLVSAEAKWRRLSGLVLLLPHGMEGQGPEHSSARLERFLSLAATDNMQIVSPTTPAQYFHVLRRQALRHWRKPLVVMTPKSLLRHPGAVSRLEDLASGAFQRIIPDTNPDADGSIRRVLLCTGKVFYDLLRQREELKRADVAIVRMEQLYPLPAAELQAALASYSDGTPVVWVQEEPRNMGAWPFLLVHLGESLFGRLPLSCVTRPDSASPATGSGASHKLEQKRILEEAFGGVRQVTEETRSPAPASTVANH